VRTFIQVTALAAVVAVAAAAPAAAMHGPGEGRPTAQPSSAPQLTERDLRLEQLGPKYVERRKAPVSVRVIRLVRAEGFAWADAAVGAGFAATVVAFAAGVVLLARHRKPVAESASNVASV
jgi:hypothetical protein